MTPIQKTAAVLAAAVLGAMPVLAATPAVQAAIAARKANFKEIGGSFKAINDELRTGAPDFATVRPAARNIAQRAADLTRHFPRGSGPESGENTRAKAEIWAQSAQFGDLQRRMIAAANQLNAAAVQGEVAGLTAARTALGATCKSCHDQFRTAS